MILSNSRRFIFLHIHKTGGESIAAALEPYLDTTDLFLNGGTGFQLWLQRRLRKRYAQFAMLDKHSSALTIRDNVSTEMWNGYYKFAFVRHPVDRTISLYHFCARMAELRKLPFPNNVWYRTPPGQRDDPLRWPAMQAFLGTASFSEFIRHPALGEDRGMQPQVNSICDRDGAIVIDFVARFERFDDDFATIQDAIGLPRLKAARTNVSRDRSVTRSTLTNEDLAHLETQFAIDFERLDYEL